ncbi:methyltransferase [Fulvivirgaceae bacterium BMA10]|uniref:Methyltransferase n=1 Tax=Splendidivirga corallicola TaxID=3051826 RepID=A0ABT8KUS6_9BACT|nr:methyltransferase [Fulvivirgaceae bacterium BMA10]
MKKDAAHNSIYQTSDFILIAIFIVGALIEYGFLWHWSLPIAIWIRLMLGIIFLIIGIYFIMAGKSALDKEKQPSEPGKPTTHIVQSGIYKVTRNPTYLGCCLLLLGSGVTFNFIAWMAGSFICFLLMHHFLVLPEEKYLMSKFPEAFSSYVSKVKRWL